MTWVPTSTHFPTRSLYPTRFKTRIPSSTASPSKPTLYPTAGSGQSGGGANNGLLNNGKLNAVDVTLIIFFAIFGVVLVAACGFVAVENIQKGRRPARNQQTLNPVIRPAVSYEAVEGQ